MVQEKTLRVAHLCCGIGGVATGFKEAGYTTVYANDIWPAVAQTFETNLGVKVEVCDVNNIDRTQLPAFEVLTASTPRTIARSTEELSITNPILQGINQVIQAAKPKVFCLDSMYVPSVDDGQSLWCQSALEEYEALGYTVMTTIVSEQVEGGCPSPRKVLLVLGFLESEQAKRFKGVSPVKHPLPIKDCLQLEGCQSDHWYLPQNHSSSLAREVEKVTPEEVGVYRIHDFYTAKELRRNQFLPLDLETGTMQAVSGRSGCSNYVIRDVKGIRFPTIKEWLSLKGFPTTFKLISTSNTPQKSSKEAILQIGAATCVPLAKQIALAIQETF